MLNVIAGVVSDVLKVGSEWKSKIEETKQRELSLKNETRQREIDATKETRKAELGSLDHSTNKMTEVSNNAIDKNSEVTKASIVGTNELSSKIIDKTSDITSKSMEGTHELSSKIIDNSKDMIEYINEDKKNVVDSSKEHYDKLVQIQEYTHNAQIETTYYRTREETLNEISKNVSTYAESIRYINEKIQHLGLEIQSKKKKIESDKKVFEELKQDLKLEESKYQDLNNDFNALIDSIEKLACEYKDSMEEKEYLKSIKREKRELQKHIDKIENIELKLLNKEKEKLIIDKKLKPKLDEIENLKLSLEYLKNERDSNEFTGLLNLSNIQTNNLLQGSSEANIIDAEIEDDKKLLGV